VTAVDRPGSATTGFVLPERVRPVPDKAGLDAPYWEGVRAERLAVQRCRSCASWQWGPEWACYTCASLDVGWEEVPTTDGRYLATIYSWERVWHPTDPRLAAAVPYLILLVTVPAAGAIRMVGNYVGDQLDPITIGDEVCAVFEHHDDYSLVQWQPTRREVHR
jgi:uncharacterized OB-fold protein